jgi:hypothetical protein
MKEGRKDDMMEGRKGERYKRRKKGLYEGMTI